MESKGIWPNPSGTNNQLWFTGNTTTDGGRWVSWDKPSGFSVLSIFLLASGGGGGTGVIGAAGAAAGGGGGGSGCQTTVLIPMYLVPSKLYLSIGIGSTLDGVPSYVSAAPDATSLNDIICLANAGSKGGNASGATPGAAGATGSAATASVMPLGWGHVQQALAGQAGIIGSAGTAASLTQPTTGLRVTGATGGSGVPAAGAGAAGGQITTPRTAGTKPTTVFPLRPSGSGGSATTTPPSNGQNGIVIYSPGLWFYGGTSGGATHATATGAGLVQASGGKGSYGCGGAGMSGALTGSTPGTQASGGSGLCILTWW